MQASEAKGNRMRQESSARPVARDLRDLIEYKYMLVISYFVRKNQDSLA